MEKAGRVLSLPSPKHQDLESAKSVIIFALKVGRLDLGWIGRIDLGWIGRLDLGWIGRLDLGWIGRLDLGWIGKLDL